MAVNVGKGVVFSVSALQQIGMKLDLRFDNPEV